MDSILHLPDGKVKFFWDKSWQNSNYRSNARDQIIVSISFCNKIIMNASVKMFSRLVKMPDGLVHCPRGKQAGN